MSRIANAPVEIPAGVEVALKGSEVSIKGTKGTLGTKSTPGKVHYSPWSVSVCTCVPRTG